MESLFLKTPSAHGNDKASEDLSQQPQNMTMQQALDDLRGFAEDFSEFTPDTTIPTPQADFGIGAVKYDIDPDSLKLLPKAVLQILSEIVDLEKENGDRLVKVLATMNCALFGKEDPFPWLPALEREVLRIQIQEATNEIVESTGLADKDDIPTCLEDLVEECEKQCRPVNSAEIAFLADIYTDVEQAQDVNEDESRIFENFE